MPKYKNKNSRKHLSLLYVIIIALLCLTGALILYPTTFEPLSQKAQSLAQEIQSNTLNQPERESMDIELFNASEESVQLPEGATLVSQTTGSKYSLNDSTTLLPNSREMATISYEKNVPPTNNREVLTISELDESSQNDVYGIINDSSEALSKTESIIIQKDTIVEATNTLTTESLQPLIEEVLTNITLPAPTQAVNVTKEIIWKDIDDVVSLDELTQQLDIHVTVDMQPTQDAPPPPPQNNENILTQSLKDLCEVL